LVTIFNAGEPYGIDHLATDHLLMVSTLEGASYRSYTNNDGRCLKATS